MTTFWVLILLLALLELGVAVGWARDSRDGRYSWPFVSRVASRMRHDGE
ncbi:MAG: hypothetical protein ACM3ZF_08495 [Mycobacterium leprae]